MRISDEEHALLEWLRDPEQEYEREAFARTLNNYAREKSLGEWLAAVNDPNSAAGKRYREDEQLRKMLQQMDGEDAQLRKILQQRDGHDTESGENDTKPPMPAPRLNEELNKY